CDFSRVFLDNIQAVCTRAIDFGIYWPCKPTCQFQGFLLLFWAPPWAREPSSLLQCIMDLSDRDKRNLHVGSPCTARMARQMTCPDCFAASPGPASTRSRRFASCPSWELADHFNQPGSGAVTGSACRLSEVIVAA